MLGNVLDNIVTLQICFTSTTEMILKYLSKYHF